MSHQNKHNKMYNNQLQFNLLEGLEFGDLARLIHPELHIDEFKSKMGDDSDIIVLSFLVGGKEPAVDLMNFIERGYDWVLDADVSSGELDNGEYLVFVELARDPTAVENIIGLLDDVLNLADQNLADWSFQYRKDPKKYSITTDNIKNHVPLSDKIYVKTYGQEDPDKDFEKDLESMKNTAKVPNNKKAPVNDFTESLRVFAGLK